MRQYLTAFAAGLVALTGIGIAQRATADDTYHVEKTAKVGGEGGFDYVYADPDGRKLYVARSRVSPRISVFNLDTLEPAGEIPMTSAHGAATDTRSHHGFASSSPVAMWDTKTLAVIKTISVQGNPDGMLADAYNHRIYIFSHSEPNVTVLDAANGTVLGTIDLGGEPEQAASDGKGRIFVDLENKGSVAVVDANSMKVTATYSLNGKGGGNAGLALDAKNNVLFVACREPQVMVMLDANTGKYLADLPIGRGCDGVAFNPKTGECLSSQGDGTLTIIKKKSTGFVVEQTLTTMSGAKTLTLDTKTGKIFLIAAVYGAPTNPPPANSRFGGRGPMVPGSFSIIVVGK
jgi:DNA-binding beta-propeller fold protein YncE